MSKDPKHRGTTLKQRFDAKWEADPETGCWMWTASLKRTGYGQIRVYGHYTRAHRAAYELYVGPIPEGMHIDHLCRTKACVNPAHLEPVSQAENTRRGDTAIIKEKDLLDIHLRYNDGERQYNIAKDYGVGVATISNLIRGKTWREYSPNRRGGLRRLLELKESR